MPCPFCIQFRTQSTHAQQWEQLTVLYIEVVDGVVITKLAALEFFVNPLVEWQEAECYYCS